MMLSDLDLEGSTQEEASAEDAECDATLFYDYQPMPFMSRLVTQDEYFLTRVCVATSFSKKPLCAAASGAAATSTAGGATGGAAKV